MASNIESPNLSRRGFVFAAGTAALAAAGAGACGCAPAAIKEGEGNAPEKKAVPDVFTDGTYITHGTSMHGPIDVKTVIEGGAIASVAVLNHNESRVVGEHAIEKMPQRIVESQCVDADAITGATVTSMAIKNAVVDAVIAAGGDPDDFSGYAAPAPTPRTVEKSADVAIMGAGPAGLMAAWAAAEKGKSVVICERMGYTGGCTPITGGGIYTQETQLQRAWGLDLVPETHSTVEHRLEIYAGRMQAEDNPYYNPDMPFIRTILESSSRAVDKMLGHRRGLLPHGRVGRAAVRPRRLPDRRQVRHGDRHALRHRPVGRRDHHRGSRDRSRHPGRPRSRVHGRGGRRHRLRGNGEGGRPWQAAATS